MNDPGGEGWSAMSPPPEDGMGAHASGPSFAPWDATSAGDQPPAETPERPAAAADFRHRRSRLAGGLTVGAIVVVAVVVAVASLWAVRTDRQQVAPRVVALPTTPTATPSHDRIEFTTPDGSGVLIIRDHRWEESSGAWSGTQLTVDVELICRTGEVSYAPYNFQAFDRSGELYDVVDLDHPADDLGIGTLTAGERVRGGIAFEIDRGDVTLLMSDDSSQSVTALKIPD